MITDEEKDILVKNIKNLLDLIDGSTIISAGINVENQITEIPDPRITFVKYAPTGIREITVKIKLKSDLWP